MSLLDPTTTTPGDLATEALRESGAFGQGQEPLAADQNGAIARLQWMLQQWQRQRWKVYHEVILVIPTSTSLRTFGGLPGVMYTVGPGGDFDTNASSPTGSSTRPDGVEAAFLRQPILGAPGASPVDFPLERMEAMEDYMRLPLKSLISFPGAFYYDPAWPQGQLLVYPVPQANIYQIGIALKEQLPQSFGTSPSTKFVLPYEYYYAMMTNLAIMLRPKYGIVSGPGDMLPGLAKEALKVVMGSNTQIPRLVMPKALTRPGLYNIFSDQTY